jgi:hypothetical protein
VLTALQLLPHYPPKKANKKKHNFPSIQPIYCTAFTKIPLSSSLNKKRDQLAIRPKIEELFLDNGLSWLDIRPDILCYRYRIFNRICFVTGYSTGYP